MAMKASDAPPLWVGLDIGGTKTAVLVVNQAQQPCSQLTQATDTHSPERLLAGTVQAIHRALYQAGAGAQQIAGIGMGVPGQVDRETGEVRLAVNLNLVAYPLGPALSAAFHIPCFLENDVRLATLGAYQYIQQTDPLQHVAYLSIGTGIAAGLILDGRLHRGANGMAGEIGHIIVEPNGNRCNCGLTGCLEAMAAGPAIARLAAARMREDGEQAPLMAASVYQAAVQGNPAAQEVVATVSGYLGRAVQWLIMSYDVEKVVLGGGVTRAGAAFLEPIQRELAKLRAQSALAQVMLAAEKVTLLPPDYDAGTWGAVRLAQQGG